jgi:hypothetical protein
MLFLAANTTIFHKITRTFLQFNMIHRHDAAVSTNCLYFYCAAHYLLAAKLENKAGTTVVSLTIRMGQIP